MKFGSMLTSSAKLLRLDIEDANNSQRRGGGSTTSAAAAGSPTSKGGRNRAAVWLSTYARSASGSSNNNNNNNNIIINNKKAAPLCGLPIPSLSRNRSSKHHHQHAQQHHQQQGTAALASSSSAPSPTSSSSSSSSPSSSSLLRAPIGAIRTMMRVVSEEEELEQIFGELDGDGDGKISAVEVGRILELLGAGGGSGAELMEAAERMVAEADGDGDGFIGLQEFITMSRSSYNSYSYCSSPDKIRDPDSDLADAFRVFDLDRNGRITADELHIVLSRLAASACSFDDCRRMIMRVDHKGLGHVDFDDFKLLMMMPAASSCTPPRSRLDSRAVLASTS